MTIRITSAQEAAANAVGKLALDLGLGRLSLSAYPIEGHFYASGEIGDVTATGSGKTNAEALRKMLDELSDRLSNPQPKLLREPAQVKKAALELVDEYRGTEDGKTVFAPLLNELADRVAAIPVKE